MREAGLARRRFPGRLVTTAMPMSGSPRAQTRHKLSPIRRMADLPILGKVMLGPLAALLALAALSAIGGYMLDRHRDRMIGAYMEVQPTLVRSMTLPANLARLRSDLYGLALRRGTGTGTTVEQPVAAIRRRLDLAGENIAALERAGLRGATDLVHAFGSYRRGVSQALVLIERDAALGAVAVGRTDRLSDAVERRARSFSARAFRDFRAAARRADRAAADLYRNFALTCLAAAVIVLLIGIFTALAMTLPVRLIVRAIRNLHRGDLSSPVPLQDQRDEFGEVARIVARFRDVLIAKRAREEEHERQRAELDHMAYHDPLTRLANRQGMDRFLALALKERRADNLPVAFMILDLDGFKPVNDRYGHAAGDAVLVEVAARLRTVTREGDLAARIGGDEFGVVVTGLRGAGDVERLAERLAAALDRPIRWQERAIRIGASIGAALSSDTESDPDGLFARADEAMYAAKRDHGAVWKIHTRSGSRAEAEAERRGVRAALEQAIRKHQVLPCYRPIVRLADCRLVGLAVELRWHLPGQTPLEAGAFMADLRDAGLLPDVTLAAAHQVVATVSEWLAEGLEPGRVSFALPAPTLASAASLESLEGLFAEHPEAARRVTVEIPEDFLDERAGRIILENVGQLRRRHIRIALGGFGASHGSLALLREGKFDEIRIDGSLVAGIGRERSAELMIGAALDVASGLGLDSLAGGVRSEEQERHLRRSGCRLAVGDPYGALAEREETTARLREGLMALPRAERPPGLAVNPGWR